MLSVDTCWEQGKSIQAQGPRDTQISALTLHVSEPPKEILTGYFARQTEWTHPPWAESIQAQMSEEIINMGVKDCLKDSGCLEVRLNYLFPVPVLVSFGHKLPRFCFHLNLRISQLLTHNLLCCSLWKLLTVHSLAGLWSVYKRAEKLQFSSSSASSRRYSLPIMVIPLILRNHLQKKMWGEKVL